ncbi:uncharacterized protein [Miscanthus floridulus]|uniref:uncharacterized protein n=1 Tax=Miscanthus floridulus TaxID=154761 RepID=UPI00345B3370
MLHEPADTATGVVKRFFRKKIRKLKKLHYRHKFAKEIQDLHDLVNEVYDLLGGVRTSNGETRKECLMTSLHKLGGNNLRDVKIDEYDGRADCFVDSWCPPPLLLQKFIHDGQHCRFPKWISSCLCDLTYLDIRVQKMEREHLRILEDLPAIRFLYLDVKQVTEDGLIVSYGAFRSLTCFQFYNIDGPGLVFEGGMRMLEWLRLEFDTDKALSAYGSLEVGIGHLSNVKRIDLTIRITSEGENDPAEKAVKSVINGQVNMLPNCATVHIGFSRRPACLLARIRS